jgi:hypothetical protein
MKISEYRQASYFKKLNFNKMNRQNLITYNANNNNTHVINILHNASNYNAIVFLQ